MNETESNLNETDFEYDVALSFAGEQREYVEEVAKNLKSRGILVFYDDYERGALWGKDLYAHLSDVYYRMCRYCIIFVSAEYAAKVWPNLERRSAQSRALKEKQEYILPARFDGTEIPGLLDTVGYIDLNRTSPSELSEMVSSKLGKRVRKNYLPPTLDRLYGHLGIEQDTEAQTEVRSIAWSFFEVLRRMTVAERNAVVNLIRFGCDDDLPENVHIHTDLLHRMTGIPPTSLQRLLGGVGSLGFECSLVEDTEGHIEMPGEILGECYLFYLTWVDLTSEGQIPALLVASAMIEGATEDYCVEHGREFLERLDFSQLADATSSKEVHTLER